MSLHIFLEFKRNLKYCIQFAPSVPGRFAFYGIKWYCFEIAKIKFKIQLRPWSSGSKQIWNWSFKRGTKCSFWSMGCKTVVPQSSRSKKYLKNDVVAFPRLNLLCSGARENTRINPKCLESANSSVHTFATLWVRNLNYLSIKILINIYLEPEDQGRSCILNFSFAISK